jgi:hypothetical protein
MCKIKWQVFRIFWMFCWAYARRISIPPFIFIICQWYPRYINSLHNSIWLPFRNHFSSGLQLPLFLKITILVFDKFIYKSYSGYYTAPDIEKVHLYFLKRILKVRKSTVNNMVYCELGRLPLYVERQCKMVNLMSDFTYCR